MIARRNITRLSCNIATKGGAGTPTVFGVIAPDYDKAPMGRCKESVSTGLSRASACKCARRNPVNASIWGVKCWRWNFTSSLIRSLLIEAATIRAVIWISKHFSRERNEMLTEREGSCTRNRGQH